MPGTEEVITEESIEAYEKDLEQLKSKEDELIKLIKEFKKKEGEIKRLQQTIESGNMDAPRKPGTLRLSGAQEWNDYLNRGRVWIRNKKEQDERKKQLDDLKDEYEKNRSMISSLVPPIFYGIQIHLKDSQILDVFEDRVISH
ncbi:MAG: hypothetical protein WA137_01950 [Methanothrix sp.]